MSNVEPIILTNPQFPEIPVNQNVTAETLAGDFLRDFRTMNTATTFEIGEHALALPFPQLIIPRPDANPLIITTSLKPLQTAPGIMEEHSIHTGNPEKLALSSDTLLLYGRVHRAHEQGSEIVFKPGEEKLFFQNMGQALREATASTTSPNRHLRRRQVIKQHVGHLLREAIELTTPKKVDPTS